MSRRGERPYDCAMSDELRVAVRERRLNPTGKQLQPKIEMRGNTEILAYPWDEMKVGDFFLVPLLGRRADAVQVRLRQAAQRRDWELTIVQWKSGTDYVLRVCLTLLDVSEIKRKAQAHHDARGIRFGDGRWSATRKARYRRSQGSPKLRVVSAPEVIVTPPKSPPVEMDASLSPDYDRDAVIRQRLKSLGINP